MCIYDRMNEVRYARRNEGRCKGDSTTLDNCTANEMKEREEKGDGGCSYE